MTTHTAELSQATTQAEEEAMSVQNRTVNAVGPDGKWLYRVGGISALAIGLGYIIIIPLYLMAGYPPSGGEAKLAYLAENTTAWWAIIGLSILTDLLYIPFALALYLALKEINQSAMLLAAACLGLFTALELAISWPNYAALISLSSQYTAATTDAQRAIFIAGADYVSALLATPLMAIYTILVPGMGIFIAGLVMLKGLFGKGTAYLGVVTGSFALIASVGPFLISALDVAIVIVSLLTTFWFLFAGYRLYRLGGQ
jgi:hypothetical protein